MFLKVTPCKHFFHAGCLKKWLFVQDLCPMCSSKITEQSTTNNHIFDQAANIEEVEDEDWNVIPQDVINQQGLEDNDVAVIEHIMQNREQFDVEEIQLFDLFQTIHAIHFISFL